MIRPRYHWTHSAIVGLAAISLPGGWPYWCPRCGLPCEIDVRRGISYFCMGPAGRGHEVSLSEKISLDLDAQFVREVRE